MLGTTHFLMFWCVFRWAYCSPGRFFAINEIKAVIAFMLLRYDFKLDGVRPPNLEFRGTIMPSTTGKIQFRRRRPVDETK
jgi:cytochrome P450